MSELDEYRALEAELREAAADGQHLGVAARGRFARAADALEALRRTVQEQTRPKTYQELARAEEQRSARMDDEVRRILSSALEQTPEPPTQGEVATETEREALAKTIRENRTWVKRMDDGYTSVGSATDEEIADAILAAGFRRTVQAEQSLEERFRAALEDALPTLMLWLPPAYKCLLIEV